MSCRSHAVQRTATCWFSWFSAPVDIRTPPRSTVSDPGRVSNRERVSFERYSFPPFASATNSSRVTTRTRPACTRCSCSAPDVKYSRSRQPNRPSSRARPPQKGSTSRRCWCGAQSGRRCGICQRSPPAHFSGGVSACRVRTVGHSLRDVQRQSGLPPRNVNQVVLTKRRLSADPRTCPSKTCK